MFALTRKTDYALIALTDLARRPGEICNAREIAERYNVPPALLTNVMKKLGHAEFVRSIRGAKGGYSLALPADEIRLGAIIEAIEGPVRFVQCAAEPEPGESPCELAKTCPVTRTVRRVHDKLTEFLNNVTLADIAADGTCCGGEGVAVSIEGQAMVLASMEPAI